MTTRSTRLAALQIAAAGDVVAFTCPASNVTLVKYLYVQNAASATNHVVMYLEASGGAAFCTIYEQDIVTNTLGSWAGWAVLEAGDRVHLNTNAAPTWIWLSGAILPAAPAPT